MTQTMYMQNLYPSAGSRVNTPAPSAARGNAGQNAPGPGGSTGKDWNASGLQTGISVFGLGLPALVTLGVAAWFLFKSF